MARPGSQTNVLRSAPIGQRFAAAPEPVALEQPELNLTYILVWLFVFEAFVRVEDILPIVESLHVVLLLAIAGTLAYLGSLVAGKLRFQWSPELGLVLLLSAWFAAGIPFAFWKSGSLHLLVGDWLRTVLFFFLLTQTLTTVGRVRKIIWAVLLSMLLANAASLLMQGNPAYYDAGGRFTGINKALLGWNFLGITLSATLPFIAYLYVASRSVLRILLLFAVLGSSLWMLVLTASRGGVLGIAFSLMLSWWFLIRGSSRSLQLTVVVGLCLVVAVAKAPPIFWERLLAGSSTTQWNENSASAADSTQERERLLEDSIGDTLRHPMFGLGIGNFSAYHGTLGQSEGWLGPHNTFTQISAEAGVPALLIFLCLMGVMIRHMKQVSDGLKDKPEHSELRLLAHATLASALAFVFAGFFAHLAYAYLVYYIIAIGAAIRTLASGKIQPATEQVGFPGRVSSPYTAKQAISWR
ncbi:MAG TPA: O-antigen ligase family protein [Candidatus Sulfotelmatobacter sp.]|nr:O-antigen ligase family protein [Candidatus Sulfotelmatobacter sp.]